MRPYWRLLKRGIPFDVIIDRYVPQYYTKQMTYHARGHRSLRKAGLCCFMTWRKSSTT